MYEQIFDPVGNSLALSALSTAGEGATFGIFPIMWIVVNAKASCSARSWGGGAWDCCY